MLQGYENNGLNGLIHVDMSILSRRKDPITV